MEGLINSYLYMYCPAPVCFVDFRVMALQIHLWSYIGYDLLWENIQPKNLPILVVSLYTLFYLLLKENFRGSGCLLFFHFVFLVFFMALPCRKDHQ